jgi:hypothetical protein
MLALPLAIPAYGGGIVHLTLMRPRRQDYPQAVGKCLAFLCLLLIRSDFRSSFHPDYFQLSYIYLLSGALSFVGLP